jgi:hypothetical protein
MHFGLVYFPASFTARKLAGACTRQSKCTTALTLTRLPKNPSFRSPAETLSTLEKAGLVPLLRRQINRLMPSLIYDRGSGLQTAMEVTSSGRSLQYRIKVRSGAHLIPGVAPEYPIWNASRTFS